MPPVMGSSESRWRGGYVPAELNGFVGRRELLSAAKAKLADPTVRLLSLTGGGGTGKSRLAMRLASEARRAYPDGVWWVELASVPKPELVGSAVRGALPINNQSTRGHEDVLVTELAGRTALLVLDNCEHLIGTLATLVVHLLHRCPRLRIITTSRVPLHCEGEHLLYVPPLSVPADPDRAVATEYEAVRLFEARASAAKAGFAVTRDNAADVARLAQMLDGIPLAIELAAPMVRVTSLRELVSLLSTGRFGALTAGPDVPSHHRTLWDTFNWSYQLCSQAERMLWSRLAVFAGSFTMDAAVAVASDADLDAAQVPVTVRDLVSKNIVMADTGSAPTRYAMLATVREYGLARLREGGALELDTLRHRFPSESSEEAAVYRRLHHYYLQRSVRLSRDWYSPDERRFIWEALEDLPNYRAVLDQCASPGTREDAETGARIAIALATLRMWVFGGTLGEGLQALVRAERVLAQRNCSSALRLTALAKAAWLALCLGDRASTEDLLERCRSLAAKLDDGEETATALANLDYLTAVTALLTRGDPAAVGLLAGTGRSLAAADDPGAAPQAELMYAIAAAFSAPKAQAIAAAEAHLADTRAHGADWLTSWAEWTRALVELRHGDPRTATTMFRSALRSQRDMGDQWGSTWSMEALAWAAAARGRHEEAAVLLGATENMRNAMGVTLDRLVPWAEAHAACVSQVSEALGGAYRATMSQGSAMEIDDAADLAMGQPSGRRTGAPPPARPPKPMLSDKQQAVAELIAEGKTDKQIASALFLSPRTVQSHVSAILRNLGFSGRTEIARWVIEQRNHKASVLSG